MKKTLTANISGTVFHIEEDAYDKLQRYLANIRAQFNGTEGRDEIMSDIEARIAELFNERLQGRQVVSIAAVDHVITVMGQPEDFGDGEPVEPERTNEPISGTSSKGKRFFRDPDDKWLGGVIGGLGAYINVDPLWLRIAMIVLVSASIGSLIPLYVLLWILVPKADNATDRLQMRGEAVTVDNIKRAVEEGAERVKQGGERFANEASSMGRDWSQRMEKNGGRAVAVIAKLIGVFLLITAFGLLLSMVTGLIGGSVSLWHATWTSDDMGFLDLGGLLFNSREHALWFGIGAFTLLVVPILGLFLAGFRLLLNTRTPKWLGWSLVLIWFLALVPTIWAALDLAKDFKRENSMRTEVELVQPASGLLYLDTMVPTVGDGDWSVEFNNGELNVDLEGLHVENGLVKGAWAHLDVERSADTLYHLKALREAYGSSAKTALGRASRIQFSYQQEGDVLFVSPVLEYPVEDRIRAQDLKFTLEVPLGKSIFLRPGSKKMIYDIDNVTNTYDRDMLGRTWTMTSRGLEDLNAPSRRDQDPTAPVDTIRATGPIAAVVWQGTRRTKASQRPQPTTHSTATPVADTPRPASLVPNVLGLLLDQMTLN